MKKILTFCLGALLASPAFATLIVDGDLADWGVKRNSLASGWTPNSGIRYTIEDQNSAYLNPGYGGQAYDAEALYATTQGGKLFVALATGHNPRTVNNPGGNSYGAGDFAIDFGKNGSYELGINIRHTVIGANGNTLESFGADGDVYKNPTWALGLWGSNGQLNQSHPDPTHPAYLTSGSKIGSATLAYTTGAQTGFGQWANDSHYFYEMSIDLDLLTAAGWDGKSAFNIHWTENCANDGIIVDPDIKIPEPASLALLSIGLLAIVGTRRRKSANLI